MTHDGHLTVSEFAHLGRRVVSVAGEVHLGSRGALIQALDRAVRVGHEPSVVVDLEHVTFMDSAGLATLLNALRRLTRQGRTLEVRNARDPVRRVVEAARLVETLGLDGAALPMRARPAPV